MKSDFNLPYRETSRNDAYNWYLFLLGGNHLILKEAGMTSKKICGKSPSQLIVSTTEELTFVLIINKNTPRVWIPSGTSNVLPSIVKHYFQGLRVKIGFIQIGEPNGWTIDEYNKGKKVKALPKSPPKGKRPPPKLKSAGPGKKSPPKKSPKKPKKPNYHSPGIISYGPYDMALLGSPWLVTLYII